MSFGDSPALSRHLLALVRAGRKTATCAALRDYADEPLPHAGAWITALDWDGNPALLVEVTQVDLIRFDAVDTDFALAEGEDATLADWQAGHRAWFERNGGWSPDLMLVCQRFRLLADLAAGTGP